MMRTSLLAAEAEAVVVEAGMVMQIGRFRRPIQLEISTFSSERKRAGMVFTSPFRRRRLPIGQALQLWGAWGVTWGNPSLNMIGTTAGRCASRNSQAGFGKLFLPSIWRMGRKFILHGDGELGTERFRLRTTLTLVFFRYFRTGVRTRSQPRAIPQEENLSVESGWGIKFFLPKLFSSLRPRSFRGLLRKLLYSARTFSKQRESPGCFFTLIHKIKRFTGFRIAKLQNPAILNLVNPLNLFNPGSDSQKTAVWRRVFYKKIYQSF